METVLTRPLYRKFAWAYDLIIVGPISRRCDFIEEMLFQHGILPGSKILDAGCGTGSYSIELARRGYAVTGIDVSKELVSVARRKPQDSPLLLTFEVGDILKPSSMPRFDAVLCRGVLNDVIDDESRRKAFFSFAGSLHRGGILLLDVREWNSTRLGKMEEPLFEKSLETHRGKLNFRSVTRFNDKTRQLIISECFTIEEGDAKSSFEYDFVMRCRTKEELHSNLTEAGFRFIKYFGDYAHDISVGSTDRIVAAASMK
ncbi:unnamed protein product [marine sediment metagenome]|uniref:Methyltransferase domain-containing protein n=1 Tax=marine sediment metagenome TaxID=412755 RepID=X0RV29_9ZZZZ